jgi:hypothetical protein
MSSLDAIGFEAVRFQKCGVAGPECPKMAQLLRRHHPNVSTDNSQS